MADLSLGIDIGGTFTDIVVYDPGAGRHHIWKEPTTPGDPAEGVVAGIKGLLATGAVAARDIARVVHATTLFSNALIERKGARTGLITTAGFRDVLEIGRERKFELYDIFIEMPKPLVPRVLRREVAERLDPNGAVEVPLDTAALLAEAGELVEQGVVSIAVVFLHSYANPVHERAAAHAIAARYPEISLTTSAEVAPEIREFERTSTTVANAFVKPLAETYLDRLGERIAGLEIDGPFSLMLSNGGLTHLDEAKRRPVQLLESGPAAGALAGAYFGKASGETEVLAFDMGGTTAKVSLIDGGEPSIAYGFEAARTKRFAEGSGLPIMISTIELIEVGAGGGSIASADVAGGIQVGPRSAGAVPGPACYDLGGSQPTVTDANLVLGYLNPTQLVGGDLAVSLDKANESLAGLARDLDQDVVETAYGIHRLVNANMIRAMRGISIERGCDPSRLTLVAIGGNGGVHAAGMAQAFAMTRVIVPPVAGLFSALGLLFSDVEHQLIRAFYRRLDETDPEALNGVLEQMIDEAHRLLASEGFTKPASREIEIVADMKYFGQGSTLGVPMPHPPRTRADLAALASAFDDIYEQTFGHRSDTEPHHFVTVKVIGRGLADAPRVPDRISRTREVFAERDQRQAYFGSDHGWRPTPVMARRDLTEELLAGPLIIEEYDATTVVGPGWSARRDDWNNIVLERADGRKEDP